MKINFLIKNIKQLSDEKGFIIKIKQRYNNKNKKNNPKTKNFFPEKPNSGHII